MTKGSLKGPIYIRQKRGQKKASLLVIVVVMGVIVDAYISELAFIKWSSTSHNKRGFQITNLSLFSI